MGAAADLREGDTRSAWGLLDPVASRIQMWLHRQRGVGVPKIVTLDGEACSTACLEAVRQEEGAQAPKSSAPEKDGQAAKEEDVSTKDALGIGRMGVGLGESRRWSCRRRRRTCGVMDVA